MKYLAQADMDFTNTHTTELLSLRYDFIPYNNFNNEFKTISTLVSICPFLTKLHLGGYNLNTVANIQHPEILQDLRFYFVEDFFVISSILPFFQQLTNLHTLALGGECLSDRNWKKIVAALPNPQQIRELRLANTPLTSHALRDLPRLFPNLRTLILCIRMMHSKVLQEMIQSSPRLQQHLTCLQVHFTFQPPPPEESISDENEETDVDYEFPISGYIIPMFSFLPALHNLRLVFEDCERSHVQTIVTYILHNYPFASQLYDLAVRVHYNNQQTKFDLQEGNWRYINLRSLDLYGIYFPSMSSMHDVLAQCKNLQLYYLQWKSSETEETRELDTMYRSYCNYREWENEKEDNMGRPVPHY